MSTPEDKTPISNKPVLGKPVIKKTTAPPADPRLPATSVSPSDIASLTGLQPAVPVPAQAPDTAGTGTPAPAAPGEPAAVAGPLPEGSSVDADGVPLGPDGQPLTRRQLREWRRRQDAAAQAGGPAPTTGTVTRESLAQEAAALAERIQAASGGDHSRVDPDLLREQELLAEKARALNTGLISQVAPAATAGAASAPDTAPEPEAEAVGHEPIEAQTAHGLDSMEASAWSARERPWIIVAGIAFLLLVVALILALVF
jgi:hypothetical protein